MRPWLFVAPVLAAACGAPPPLAPPPPPVVVAPVASSSPAEASAPVPPRPMIASGSGYTCVLRSGAVSCWGSNGWDNGVGEADTATPVDGIGDAVELAASGSTTCVRRANGKVACVGRRGSHGADCTAPVCAPTDVAGIDDATQIAVDAVHVCALRATGGVRCWGEDGSAQVDGTAGGTKPPTDVPGISDAVEVAVGAGFSCARRRAGGVVCWGQAPPRKEGTGDAQQEVPVMRPPTPVPGLDDAVAIVAADARACAIRPSGVVTCFSPAIDKPPQDVAGLADVRALSLAGSSTCAVRANGSVACRDGSKSRDLPAGSALAVSQGSGFGCALRSDLHAQCWGSNDGGALGNGQHVWFSEPVEAEGIDDAVEIAVDMPGTCVRRKSGKITCWGGFSHGKAVDIAGLDDAVHLEPGFAPCVTRRSGAVVCLRLDTADFVAMPGNADHVAPHGVPLVALHAGHAFYVDTRAGKTTTIPGLADAVDLHAVYRSACAIRRSGAVVCWHVDDDFSVGKPAAPPIKRVTGVDDAVALVGYMGMCAIRKSGGVACWGEDLKATARQGVTGAIAGSASGLGTCYVQRDGHVVCNAGLQARMPWGTRFDGATPFDHAVSVGLYDDRVCAVTTEGKVLCIGSNAGGTLLRHEVSYSDTPVDVQGL